MIGDEEKSNKQSNEDEHFPTISSAGSAEELGGQIGPYRLLSILGEGGFGIVYLAERQRPVRRRVALKVIKPGMDSNQVLARFENECEALALLEHPSIARVFEAGTTEGKRPYFTMEYVEGLPLTEHCDREKLSIEERLELFRQVCEAVEYAHQKGIIHRDIKPSNILVSLTGDKAVPKIIDFGVAKAISQPLTERTLFTEQGQLLGTPEYMSPEQAEMAARGIDTRTDIYSLGVVLYELLTGVLPFDRRTLQEAGFAEVQRIIREKDPPRPSTRISSLGEKAKEVAENRRTEIATLTKRLHKELEWIPLKAMHKERKHRYRTASEFADDIQHYINGMPLIAGPPSTLYSIRKFIRRNRTLVISFTAIFITILAGIVTSTYFAAREFHAREKAELAEQAEREQRFKAEFAEEAEREQRLKAEHERAKTQEALDLVSREAYCSAIRLAQEKVKSGDLRGVRKELLATDPNLRGWEWGFLISCCDCPDWIIRNRWDHLQGVAASNDGQLFAMGVKNGIVTLWDSQKRSLIWKRVFPEVMWRGISFDPKGNYIVVLFQQKFAIVGVADGRLHYESPDLKISAITIHPDGKFLFAGTSTGQIMRFDTASWKYKIVMNLEQPVSRIICDTYGKYIAFVAHRYAHICDSSSLSQLNKIRRISAEGISDLILMSKKEVVVLLEHKQGFVYDLLNGRRIRELDPHSMKAWGGCISPQGTYIATSSEDGTINVYQSSNWERIQTFHHDSEVRHIHFLLDDTLVSVDDRGTIKKWTLSKNQTSSSETLIDYSPCNGCYGIGYRDDGRVIGIRIWGNDKNILLYDIETSQINLLPISPNPKVPRARILFRPKSMEIAVESIGGLKFYDTSTRDFAMTRFIRMEATPYHVAFDPSGDSMAVSYVGGGGIDIYDVEKGHEEVSLADSEKTKSCATCFTSDGRRLIAIEEILFQESDSTDFFPHHLLTWDCQTGQILSRVYVNDGYTKGIGIHPNNKYVAIGVGDHGDIEIWDLSLEKRLMVLSGHYSGMFQKLQFSPDGERLISGTTDNTLRIWDWKISKELLIFTQRWYVIEACFSPDGYSIANTTFRTPIARIRKALPWQMECLPGDNDMPIEERISLYRSQTMHSPRR